MIKKYVRIWCLIFTIIVLHTTYTLAYCNEDLTIDIQDTRRNYQVEKINELLNMYSNYGMFSGAALVAQEGDVIYKDGFGLANAEWDVPNAIDTKFRIASLTKQFTAMLVMQLVAEDKLSLDSSITSYLNEYPAEVGHKVSIHQLLTHSSGIPNYTSFPSYWESMGDTKSPTELMATFADSSLIFEPGERFNYSNSGYVILGNIIEEVTGQSYAEVLSEKILEPLEMSNTGYHHGRALLRNRAEGYVVNAGTLEHAKHIDMSMAFSAGGMYSTVEDMLLWDQALYTESLLPEKFKDKMFAKHVSAWGEYYGYGWNVGFQPLGNTKERIPAIHHDGVINGFRSLIVRIPDSRSTIILFNNGGNARLYNIARAICGILYDHTYDLPQRSIANVLSKVIKEEGIDSGLTFFHQVKSDDSFRLDERELNAVAYNLLNEGQPNEALSVLDAVLAVYPNSFNLHDSRGEILHSLDRTTEAIESYMKSVKLNPKNGNGLRMLKTLGVEIDQEDLYLLNTDKSWNKEMFVMPLHFAPAINYSGTEESHFPPGWRDINSSEFWSYTFAWKIDEMTSYSASQMKEDLEAYFDGLMNVVNKRKGFSIPKTVASISEETRDTTTQKYTGTIEVYDAFVNEKEMTLSVKAESHYCESEKQLIVVFKFSPKDFDAEIWQQLDDINSNKDKCIE